MLGTVENIVPLGDFGFLVDEHGKKRFFHMSNVRGPMPSKGSTVVFEPHLTPKGDAATAVRELVLPDAKHLLDEVYAWKLEAKLEDTERYFFYTEDLSRLDSGSKCYVIGRKGTGKTAISEFLAQRKDPERFSKKLSFKQFPFGELYSLSNDRYTPPNQYITLWKYVIYSCVAQLMTQDHSVSETIRSKLAKIYTPDPREALPKSINRWTSRSFEFSALGSGLSCGAATPEASTATWTERVDVLEQLIQENRTTSSYMVLFDELDEDYRFALSAADGTQYTALITSLFKATQDVKAVFRETNGAVLPILFIRDDIFGQIRDPDRTKWHDLSLALDWNIDEIQQLLAFRISRAIDPNGVAMPFDEAWGHLFCPQPIPRADGSSRSPFSVIEGRSMRRPRDYIKYLQACADVAVTRGSAHITGEMVIRADEEYSNYLRCDLEDELGATLPDAQTVFSLLGSMGKQNFRIAEFKHLHDRWIAEGRLHSTDATQVLEELFRVSAVGVHTRDDRHLFRYMNRDLQPQYARPFCIHRGLYKALSMV